MTYQTRIVAFQWLMLWAQRRLLLFDQNAALAPLRRREQNQTMRQIVVVLYVLALVTLVVSVDILFFRHHFWERLIVNVGIVLIFLAFGLRFLKRT